MGASPEAPLANRNTLSLVLVSPSTLMQLNVSSTAAFSARFSISGWIAASVVRTAIMVAMSGWIIPAPFAIPAIMA